VNNKNDNPGVTRRDFLATTVRSAASLACFPWIPKAAVAQTSTEAAPRGASIAKVRIYPAIGICRVGGSEEWFLAPEVPGLPPSPEGGYKDGDSKIKKQVQRFRIYAFDKENRVIGEITSDDHSIDWGVHLANTKAAWYGFNNPLDNGELAPGLPTLKRNQYFVTDDERERMLVIDGKKKHIKGEQTNPDGKDPKYAFEGKFWDKQKVALGDLRTDSSGRLLVFPPDGKSHSPNNVGITSFADNDGWYDDWCDGPVTASVTIKGKVFKAESAWVACVGPNFAPEIPPITTLFDVISDLNHQKGWAQASTGPLSFRKHIYPTFRRTALMKWVTNAANQREGWLPGMVDLSDEQVIKRLADPSELNKSLRKSVLEFFRNPNKQGDEDYIDQRLKIPYMVGDGINYDGSPLQWFQFPKLQYSYLRAWAEGDFKNDFDDDERNPIHSLDDIALQDQPASLTEAALEPCSGGAFHPGVELTYYLRLAPMYARNYGDHSAEPFRIAHKDRCEFVQNIGRLLTPKKAVEGREDVPPPIGHQMAGDLTRWMGLPWQCDAFSCQQVNLQENFPTAVWWPALLPIDVLTEKNYTLLMNKDLLDKQRIKFFNTRETWSRDVAGIGYHANASYWDGITNMITLWERMGFVLKRPGPKGEASLDGVPKEVFVEVGRADTMESRFNWKPTNGMLPN
jgi:hypothetical protein